MAKKSIIAIVVVVIVVVVIGIAAIGTSDDAPDIRYDYTLSYADQIGDGYLPEYPDEGYVFLIVDYTMANDSEDNLTTNVYFQQWQATLDGIVYSTDEWVSASMPGHSTVEVAPGGTVSDCVAIQVPVGHDLSEFSISLDYDSAKHYDVAFDDSLIA